MTNIADQITRDRNDEAINREALKIAIDLFTDLGKQGQPKPARQGGRFYWQGTVQPDYYNEQFEAKYLVLTQQHFEQKAQHWIMELNTAQYLD